MRSVAWLLAAPILEVGLSSNAHERDSSRAPLYLGYCRSIAAKTTAEDYETEATTLPFAWKSHAMTDHQRQFILEWQVTDTRKKKRLWFALALEEFTDDIFCRGFPGVIVN